MRTRSSAWRSASAAGDELVVNAELGHADLAVGLVEAAYRAGARHAEVLYADPRVRAAQVRGAPEPSLGWVTRPRAAYFRWRERPEVAAVNVLGETDTRCARGPRPGAARPRVDRDDAAPAVDERAAPRPAPPLGVRRVADRGLGRPCVPHPQPRDRPAPPRPGPPPHLARRSRRRAGRREGAPRRTRTASKAAHPPRPRASRAPRAGNGAGRPAADRCALGRTVGHERPRPRLQRQLPDGRGLHESPRRPHRGVLPVLAADSLARAARGRARGRVPRRPPRPAAGEGSRRRLPPSLPRRDPQRRPARRGRARGLDLTRGRDAGASTTRGCSTRTPSRTWRSARDSARRALPGAAAASTAPMPTWT